VIIFLYDDFTRVGYFLEGVLKELVISIFLVLKVKLVNGETLGLRVKDVVGDLESC